MAVRADQIHDSEADRPKQDDQARLRPIPDRQTPIDELIKQAAETHREALEILAKR